MHSRVRGHLASECDFARPCTPLTVRLATFRTFADVRVWVLELESFGLFRAVGSEWWSLPCFFLWHSVIYLPHCSLSSSAEALSSFRRTPQSSKLGPTLRRLPHWPAFRSARRAPHLVSYIARFCSLTSFTCLAFLALIVYASLYAAFLSYIYNAPMYTHLLTIWVTAMRS